MLQAEIRDSTRVGRKTGVAKTASLQWQNTTPTRISVEEVAVGISLGSDIQQYREQDMHIL